MYWYGTLQLDEAYSFLSPKLVTRYENAVKKKTHEIPAAVVRKRDDPNKVLNDNDLNIIRGFEEMKEDLPLEPSGRKRGVVNFQEDYEFEENDEQEDDEDVVDDSAKPKKKRKPVKEQEEESLDDTIKPKKKQKLGKQQQVDKDAGKPKKSSKKNTKDQKTGVGNTNEVKEVRDDEFGFDEDDVSVNQADQKMDAVKEYEQAVAADKLPESDDEMDDNYDPPSDAEEKDPDHDEDPKALKKSRAKSGKEDRKLVKIEKKEEKIKVISEEDLKKRELKAFRSCEERFCPLLERWHKLLVASQDPESLQKLLNKLLPVVNEFSAIFIEAYDISNLLKETKNVLKAKNAKLNKCAEVKEAFRESYSSKRPRLPSGLKIRKNVEIGKSVSASLKAGERQETEEPRTTPAKEETGSIAKPIAHKNSNPTEPHKETSTEPRAVSPKPAPKKKKFSLTNLMRQARVEPEAEDVNGRNTPSSLKKLIVLPSWMTEEIQEPSTLEDPRALALEFLLDMSAFFPSSKVNKGSMARAVEAAIYKDASTQSSDWVPFYWKRVHLLVASICGKLQPTSLYDLIINGRFETADQLVGLPEKTLLEAFDGDLVVV